MSPYTMTWVHSILFETVMEPLNVTLYYDLGTQLTV